MVWTLVMVVMMFVSLASPVAAQVPAPQVILDNQSVRVTAATFVPGSASGRHQGIETEVGIVLDGDLTLESLSGRVVMRPGSAYWLPGLSPHDTRNEGQRPVRLYEIFLKRCD
jgi:mannose-6-phosphate isomerase-like protein (cupin superfamily)